MLTELPVLHSRFADAAPKTRTVTLAATAVNALILAGEHGEMLTIDPRLALDLAPELVQQALQALQLSGGRPGYRQAQTLAGHFDLLSSLFHDLARQREAEDLERYRVISPSRGRHGSQNPRKNADRPAAEQ